MGAPSIVHSSDAVYHYIKMPIDRIVTGLCSIIVKHDTDDYTGDDPDDAFDPHNPMTIKTMKLIPPLVKAIQELSAKVTALEAQIN